MSGLFLLSLLAFVSALVFAQVVGGWRDLFARSWPAASRTEHGEDHGEGVTLVVPARNAAGTIAPLLQDLYAQQWPKERMEVLVVDDGSSDATADIVRGMVRNWPGLQLLPATGAGKKAAITQGVAAARWPFVLLTDADA
ncbi:MAG: glycosyltransferase, partial [Bacteroidetes bacterium]|nr:glycosyltransferase [Bacteroidota bacterium]